MKGRQRQYRAAWRCCTALLALCCPFAFPFPAVAGPTPCEDTFVTAGFAGGDSPAWTAFALPPLTAPAAAVLEFAGSRREVWLYLAAGAAVGGPAPNDALQLVIADDAGVPLWSAGSAAPLRIAAPVAASPAVLETAGGVAYRAYLGDGTGGVWRVDFPPGSPPSAWRISRLADLAGLAGDGKVSFPVAPDLVRAVDDSGRPFDGVVLAALVEEGGQRRIDLALLRVYGLDAAGRDDHLETGDLIDAAACDQAVSSCPPATGPGWYLRGASAGDALMASPLIDGGRIFLATYARASLDCEATTAVRFAGIIELESGRSLLGDAQAVALERQPLEGPAIEGGRLQLPGLAAALERASLPGELAVARGLQPRRSYWLDLLLDAD